MEGNRSEEAEAQNDHLARSKSLFSFLHVLSTRDEADPRHPTAASKSIKERKFLFPRPPDVLFTTLCPSPENCESCPASSWCAGPSASQRDSGTSTLSSASPGLRESARNRKVKEWRERIRGSMWLPEPLMFQGSESLFSVAALQLSTKSPPKKTCLWNSCRVKLSETDRGSTVSCTRGKKFSLCTGSEWVHVSTNFSYTVGFKNIGKHLFLGAGLNSTGMHLKSVHI